MIVFCMREQSRYARNPLYSALARGEGKGDVYKPGELIKYLHKSEFAARFAGVGVCAVFVYLWQLHCQCEYQNIRGARGCASASHHQRLHCGEAVACLLS